MINKGLLDVISYMERERGVSRDVIVRGIETALTTATAKHFGCSQADIKVSVERRSLAIKVTRKFIASDVEDGLVYLTLNQARRFNPNIQEGEAIEIQIPPEVIGRIGAQNVRQIVSQQIKQAERDNIVQHFRDRIGDIVSGIVHKITRKGDIFVEVDGHELILPHHECIPRDSYRVGATVKAVIQNVRTEANQLVITLSRTSNEFLRALFSKDVAEIADGQVEIVSISRDPGIRAKIAVRTLDGKIDPVGACVGMRGLRVRNIVTELQGEKVDVIRWNEDIRKYAEQALSPAKLASVKVISEAEKKLQVLVTPDQLSLAIGRSGQNVRLTSRLLGWNVDIHSIEEVQEQEEAEEFQNQLEKQKHLLAKQIGMPYEVAALLVDKGFLTPEGIIAADVPYLAETTSFDVDFAEKIWQAAEKVAQHEEA